MDLYCEFEPHDYRIGRLDIRTVDDMCNRLFFPAADIASKIDKTLASHKEEFLALLEREPTKFSDDVKSYSIALSLADGIIGLPTRLEFNVCEEKNRIVFIITEYIAAIYQCLVNWMNGRIL